MVAVVNCPNTKPWTIKYLIEIACPYLRHETNYLKKTFAKKQKYLKFFSWHTNEQLVQNDERNALAVDWNPF